MSPNTTALLAALAAGDLFRLAVYAILTLAVALFFITTAPRPKVRKPAAASGARPHDVRRRLLQLLLHRLEVKVRRLAPGSVEALFCSAHLAAARRYVSAGELGAAL